MHLQRRLLPQRHVLHTLPRRFHHILHQLDVSRPVLLYWWNGSGGWGGEVRGGGELFYELRGGVELWELRGLHLSTRRHFGAVGV